MGLNKVFLEGNICQDSELRYTQTSMPVVTIMLATNESYYDRKAGERKERTEYHTLVGWGKRFEALHQKECLLLGQGIGVIGRLSTRSWADKAGVKRWTTEVVIGQNDEDFRLQGRPNGASNSTNEAPPPHGDSTEPPPVESNKDKPVDQPETVDDFAD